MEASPAVFIGVLSYNHEDYIEECLESIKNQSYKNLIVEVFDDASSDKTLKRIEAFQKKNPRFIRKVHSSTENLGIAKNCNRAFEASKSFLFLKIFSGDDIMSTNMIESFVSLAKMFPNYPFYYSNMYMFFSGYKWLKIKFFGLLQSVPKSLEDIISDSSISSPSLFLRRQIVGDLRYDVRYKYTNDFIFLVQLIHRHGMPFYEKKPLMLYRRSRDGASFKGDGANERLRVALFLEKFLGAQYKRAIFLYAQTAYYLKALSSVGSLNKGKLFFKNLLPNIFLSRKWLFRNVLFFYSFIFGKVGRKQNNHH